MSFCIEVFEEMNTNTDGAVYFVDRSSIKPIGIGTMRHKLLGISDMLLRDVLISCAYSIIRSFNSYV